MNKYIYVSIICTLIISGCNYNKKEIFLTDTEIITKWADLTLYITKNTSGNSPTYSSRALGYIGVTMYECIVPGYPEYISFSEQLNDFPEGPKPKTGEDYDWILSLNTGQANILRSLYNQTSDKNKSKIDSLEKVIFDYTSKKIKDKKKIKNSIAFGNSVADHVFKWSQTDGGHRGYLNNFDKAVHIQEKLGSWEPPIFAQAISHFPLHPYWGKNRTFIKENSKLETPSMINYSDSPDSDYFKQFSEVYKKEKELTFEEKEIALWWGDDPAETYSPPGHSYNLATIVIKNKEPSLIKSAETYAKVGIAVADAFIICWKWKYHFFSERPSTYIAENIDYEWEPFWPDPPFPAFPSGHATQAGAVATVLSDLYGEKTKIIDSSHEGRPRDELRHVDFKTRYFDSFWQVAEETANSRFYGGIHTTQDNDVGLEEGKKMGANVNNLKLTKTPI